MSLNTRTLLIHGLFAAILGIAPLSAETAQAAGSNAASAATPGPDILTLANGDHLAGKLLSEANGTVVFHSDGAGDLTLTWDKIKSIQTAGKFAVIRQGQRVSRKAADSEVPQGAVAIDEGKIQVSAAAGGTQRRLRSRTHST